MAAGTAVSRVLGFARTYVLITAIGVTGLAADTFDIANKVPSILYMLLAGGVLNAVLVPAIVRAAGAKDGGRDFVDRLITLSIAVLAVATVLMTLAAPLLVRLYSRGYDADQLALATGFAYWCVPQLFFYGLYTVLGQVLNARGRFGAYMWAPALNNVVAIAGLGAFIVLFGADAAGHPLTSWTPTKIAVLAGTATLGVAAQGMVLWWPLRRDGYRYRPRWGVRGVGLGTARRVAMWTFAAVLVAQLGFVVTSKVSTSAASAAAGTPLEIATPGPAAYTTAYLLFMLPHSLVAVSLVTALFTRMSGAAREDDWDGVRRDLSLGLRSVGVFTVPGAALLIALAVPVGVAMAQNGSLPAGRAVGSVAAAMAVGLPAFSAAYLVQRAFYAFEDARTPFLVVIPATAVIVVVDLLSLALLPARWVVVGVGLGMSLSAMVSVTLSVMLLRRRHGSVDGHRVVRTYVRLVLAATVAGGAAWGVSLALTDLTASGRLGGIATCLAGGAVGGLLYLGGLKLLRVRELDAAVAPLWRRIRR